MCECTWRLGGEEFAASPRRRDALRRRWRRSRRKDFSRGSPPSRDTMGKDNRRLIGSLRARVYAPGQAKIAPGFPASMQARWARDRSVKGLMIQLIRSRGWKFRWLFNVNADFPIRAKSAGWMWYFTQEVLFSSTHPTISSGADYFMQLARVDSGVEFDGQLAL